MGSIQMGYEQDMQHLDSEEELEENLLDLSMPEGPLLSSTLGGEAPPQTEILAEAVCNKKDSISNAEPAGFAMQFAAVASGKQIEQKLAESLTYRS